VPLDCRRSVEKEELGFIQVKGCARGFTKVREDRLDFDGFLCSRSVHQHGVIHKLAMGSRMLQAM
jgi:hypothetical protein